jgi:hypothetical protein
MAPVDAACDAAVHTAATVTSRPDVAQLMDSRYAAYRRLYPALHVLTLSPPKEIHAG